MNQTILWNAFIFSTNGMLAWAFIYPLIRNLKNISRKGRPSLAIKKAWDAPKVGKMFSHTGHLASETWTRIRLFCGFGEQVQVQPESRSKSLTMSRLGLSPPDSSASPYGPCDTHRAACPFALFPQKSQVGVRRPVFLVGRDLPVLKIHVAPPLIEVIGNYRGEGHNAAIPRPMGLI